MFTNDVTTNSDETDCLAVNETSAILIPSVRDLAVIKYLPGSYPGDSRGRISSSAPKEGR